MSRLKTFGISLVAACIAGCAQPGASYQANSYRADQVNKVQNAKVVSILVILPAKVEVPNEQNKQAAQVIGGLVGALGGGIAGNSLSKGNAGYTAVGAAGGGAVGVAAGSLVPDKVLVDGVTLTYVEGDKTLSSTQVGRICEYKLGPSVMVSTASNETRIQPNATCPVEDTQKKS